MDDPREVPSYQMHVDLARPGSDRTVILSRDLVDRPTQPLPPLENDSAVGRLIQFGRAGAPQGVVRSVYRDDHLALVVVQVRDTPALLTPPPMAYGYQRRPWPIALFGEALGGMLLAAWATLRENLWD